MNGFGSHSFRGNRQGFLDGSNRWRFDAQRLAAKALADDREDVAALESAEKMPLKRTEGQK